MNKNKLKKHIHQAFALGLLALSVSTFTACKSDNNNTPNNTIEDIKVDDTKDNTKEPTTNPDNNVDNTTEAKDKEEPTQLLGFVDSINDADKTISFDDIEWITSEDKDKISELGLSEDDLVTGFYINNPDESMKDITYSDSVKIVLYERSQEIKEIEVTINEFKELLEQHSILCNIILENNVITNISEMYLP